MTPIVCESKLRSVVGSSMHPCLGNWVATRRADVNDALAALHLVQELHIGTVPIKLNLHFNTEIKDNYRFMPRIFT